MVYDYKKEYKEFYMPKDMPSIVTIGPTPYVAVEGKGDPNAENGAYAEALGILYAVSYTIKMSPKSGHLLDGYFDYVVPPLEGLWWMENGCPGVDCKNKAGFCWVSMIRLPEFVTEETLEWAKQQAAAKKKLDTSKAKWMLLDEGLCVQCMHIGSYDSEPATVEKMDRFLAESGYTHDFSDKRRHHEIYLGDPRKCAPEKLKTVIRHPIKKD